MATYQYRARTAAGEEISGVMQAETEAMVVRALDEKKLYPVRVREQRTHRETGKVRLRDLGIMYEQLADLQRAGVPLLRSLETIARAGVNPRLAKSLLRVRDAISSGKALAEAMAEQPGTFSNLHVAMVRAGEKAGFLEDVLSNLATFIERVDEMRGKIRGAMIYPFILILLMVAVTLGMLTVLVPRLRPMFEGRPLPLPTRLLFAVSGFVLDHWPVALAAVVVGGIGAVWFVQSDFGRQRWERWRLRVPVLGRVIRTISITRFCRILGTMIANGVPILAALGISKDATGSVVLAQHIERATESVRAGETLSEPLKVCGMFPPQILEMIAVAEESNQLETVLVKIADTVEKRTDRQVDQAVRLIEPLILVFMAGLVGLLAVALLYPVLTMAQTLH